ncbi:MAG: single-stranded DNA-binding protein [Propionibacteriaceae bacterium]|nr:single-stranded DNA-binding protein [Propionibacteriaceae bacterium]
MESQIALSGYVGGDVDFVTHPDWVSARFRLACTPRWRKGNEWVNGETTWMTIRATGNMACNVRDSVRKGDPVVVVGRLRTRRWTDVAGNKREQLVVDAIALGHDIARGVSSFMRPQRITSVLEEEEPSFGPDDEQVADDPEDDAMIEQAA